MVDLEEKLAHLAERVSTLEDELEIHRVLVRYGFAVDAGDADRMVELYTEDTSIVIDGTNVMCGRDEARTIVTGDYHQAILPNCAHLIGPMVIRVDGDRATASGYVQLYVRDGEGFLVRRVSSSRWLFERRGDSWEIAERESMMIGNDGSQKILAEGF